MRDRDTVQRGELNAGRRYIVGALRLPKSAFSILKDDGVDRGIDEIDLVEVSLHCLPRRQ